MKFEMFCKSKMQTETQPLVGTQRLANIGAETIETGQSIGKVWLIIQSVFGFIIGILLLISAIYFGTRPEPDFIVTNAVVTTVESCIQTSDKKWSCMYTLRFTDENGRVQTTRGIDDSKFHRPNETIQIQYVRGDWQNTMQECCKLKNIYIGLILFVVSLLIIGFAGFQWYFRHNKYLQTIGAVGLGQSIL